MDFHAFSEEYPLMPALELWRMEQGMRQFGFDTLFPIVLYQGKILDGRNRYLAATAAELKPETIDFDGDDDEARQFVERANEVRRHLAAEWLQRRRQERIARVAAARQEGKSLRTIAEDEKVSVATIHEDVKISTVQGLTVESPDGKTTGKDGKKRDSKKPPILCDRCTRTGKVKGCRKCLEARIDEKKAKEAKAKEKKEAAELAAPEQDDSPWVDSWVDSWGIPITKEAESAFANGEKFDEILLLLRKAKRLYKELAELPGGQFLQQSYVSANSRTGFIHNGLETCIMNVSDCKPKYTVCPYAHNPNLAHDKMNCSTCMGLGWVASIGKGSMPPQEIIDAAKKAHGVA